MRLNTAIEMASIQDADHPEFDVLLMATLKDKIGYHLIRISRNRQMLSNLRGAGKSYHKEIYDRWIQDVKAQIEFHDESIRIYRAAIKRIDNRLPGSNG